MQVETDDKVLFWQPDSIYSNWYETTGFTFQGKVFGNSEALFMYLKALAFKDEETAEEIFRKQDPKKVKHLGRKIKTFNEEEWIKVREQCMYTANLHKFAQLPRLQEELLATKNKTLVEASPLDKIWGIGLAPDDPKALDEKNWQGLNLLGNCLMDVRDFLEAY